MSPEQRAAVEAYAAEWFAAKADRVPDEGCLILLAVEVLSLSCALPEVEIPGVEARTVGRPQE